MKKENKNTEKKTRNKKEKENFSIDHKRKRPINHFSFLFFFSLIHFSLPFHLKTYIFSFFFIFYFFFFSLSFQTTSNQHIIHQNFNTHQINTELQGNTLTLILKKFLKMTMHVDLSHLGRLAFGPQSIPKWPSPCKNVG